MPRNRGKNTALLSSMSVERAWGPLANRNRRGQRHTVFEAYLEQALLPHLRPGRVVVMDNLSAHKSERVRELIEAAGCELLYLCRPTRRTLTP